MNDDDGPGWEMQDDNERRRWEEEQAINRCRRNTGGFREEVKTFEREMNELNQRIETNWSDLHGDHG